MAVLATTSRLNAIRLNAFRLGAGGHLIEWFINGARVTPSVRKYESEIHETATETPNTCLLVLRKTIPTEGQELKVTQGGSVIFDGEITSVQQIQSHVTQRLRWRVEAVDWTRLLDRRLVFQTYINQTPNGIISDVMSRYTVGFTMKNVEGNLQWLSALASATWAFNGERVSSVLAKVMAACGGIYKLRYDKDVYARVTNTIPSPLALTNANTRFKRLKRERKLDGIHTRVLMQGSTTSRVLAFLGQAATVIPVDNAFPFALPAGVAAGQAALQIPLGYSGLTQLMRISYTGVQRGGTVAAPSAQRLANCEAKPTNSAGNLTASASYQYAFTFVTSNGETAPSSALDVFVAAGTGQVSLDLIGLYDTTNGGLTHVPPDRSITAINVYRTVANGSQLLFAFQVTTSGQLDWPTSVSDNIADAALTTAPPSASAICPQGQSSTLSSTGAGVGSSTIANVTDLTIFDPAGGYALIGNQLVQYTTVAYSNSGGNHLAGTLTLAVGLAVVARSTDAIKPTPVLTGCTSTMALTPTAPTPQAKIGSSGGTTIGTLYNWAMTFVTAAGESLPGPLTGIYSKAATGTPTGVSATNKGSLTGPTNGGVYSWIVAWRNPQGMLSAVSAASGNLTSDGTAGHVTATVPWAVGGVAPTGDTFIFRTKAGGSTYYLVGTTANGSFSGTTYTVDDITTDANLTTTMAAFWIQQYTLNALSIGPTSVTSRKIYRNTGPGTGLKLVTTIANNTATTYDDVTADGSLGAAPPTTDTANAFGVPAIVPSTTAIVFVQVDDAVAQAAVAALEGGDGVHEVTLSATAPDLTAALVRAQGELAIGKNVEEDVTFTSEDQTTQVGSVLSVNSGTVVTTQKIQSQRIYWIPGRRYPQRDITASNLYKDLYQYLRDLKSAA